MTLRSQKKPLFIFSQPLKQWHPAEGWRLVGFAFVVYLLMVSLSVTCLVIKESALQFHTRDYNYFIEQAARLTDPNLSKRYTLNIEGFNMLGLQGIEGASSLKQAIHAEYFRYTYVLLYGIFRSTFPIYVFYSLVFFLPLLYYAVIAPGKNSATRLQVILFILLYILLPATLPSVTSDLRPRMLFSAAWCMLALAIYYDRSFLEKLLLFALLIGIREEGILLGAILLAFNFVQMAGKPQRWKQTLVFLAMEVIGFGAFLAFMAWGHYNRIDSMTDPRNILSRFLTGRPGLALAAIAVLLLIFGLVWWKRRSYMLSLWKLLIYGAGILITGLMALKDNIDWYNIQQTTAAPNAWDVFSRALTSPPLALVFYIIIVFLVLLISETQGKLRTAITGLVTFILAVFTATSLATFPSQMASWNQQIPEASLVWQFVNSHDRYHTHTLLDYSTYQAFYTYENILVYNRLPVWLVSPEFRYYPQNKEMLVKQIQQRMEYAVISKESYQTMLDLAKEAGVPAVEVASNNTYAILKFR